jgi:hypothetical protein
MSAEPAACARCERVRPLVGRDRQRRRICAACVARRDSGPCALCGQHRRFAGRDSQGRAWCPVCRDTARRAAQDQGWRERIITAVAAADDRLSQDVVGEVLEATVKSRRSLGLLDQHLAEHPDVFASGPTSTLAILDRFVIALVAAGAQRIATIHPICEGCGRRRPRHARLSDGAGRCATCWVRTHREPCALCQRARNTDHHNGAGQPICHTCMRAGLRRQRLDDLADEIVAVVGDADPTIAVDKILAVVDESEPNVADRSRLARALTIGAPLRQQTSRLPRVARFLDALRAIGSQLPAAACEDCRGPAHPLVVADDNVVRCGSCATRCPGCGTDTKEPTRRWCARCEDQPRGTCGDCGRADRVLDDDRRCSACRERHEHRCPRCDNKTMLTWFDDQWLCHRCALTIEVDRLLANPPPGMDRVRDAVAAAHNPAQVRKWLHNTKAGQVLALLGAGEVELSHATLDDYGSNRSVGHLRALLIAAGALPAEDRSINRLETYASGLLDTVTDSADRNVVRAWLRWHVLPRLRARHTAGASMAHSANNARRSLREVVLVLDHLHRHNRTLNTCTQADLDTWFARPGLNHWLSRGFLVWAREHRHLPRTVTIPATPARQPRPILDTEARWEIARRLVTDHTLDLADRVAGALVVLYGQPLSRIATLQTTDIHHNTAGGTVIVELDGNPVPIHEPFITLIAQLPQRRSRGVSDQLDGQWLFPGRHAGRHIGPVVLGGRLRAIGIEPRHMRNNARAQLATEIPPALLGEVIGVSTTTAARWATLTAGNWTTYAADIATP